VLGRTVASVQFQRPAPGFYSSPLLLLASTYLFVRLRATRRVRTDLLRCSFRMTRERINLEA
jgi:hypothetical protein